MTLATKKECAAELLCAGAKIEAVQSLTCIFRCITVNATKGVLGLTGTGSSTFQAAIFSSGVHALHDGHGLHKAQDLAL